MDLHAGIMRVARDHRVTSGRVTGEGSVQKAMLASFDQKMMQQVRVDLAAPMDIVSLYGEIRELDGDFRIQVHLVLSDEHGNGKGGDLLPGGTPVDCCVLVIEEYEHPATMEATGQDRTPAAGGENSAL